MSLLTLTASGLYAVVDIETTGGSVTRDRVTEIAVYVFDGQEIVDEFHSLVNPETTIPMSITQLTGISQEMVRDAPKFYEIAKRIVEVTDGHIFVAHNVSFDYSFLKAEFDRLGYKFNRQRLCTVRLARKIIPGHKSYSLGKICAELGIEIRARHRAAGDALATVTLLGHLLAKDEAGALQNALKTSSREALLPPNLPKKLFDALPKATGVYYMHDQDGRVIYVGKALNIKERIISHFGVQLDNRKALRIKEKVYDISYELTGSEIAALLLESHEIKNLRPLFNTQQKNARMNFGLFTRISNEGYIQLYISRIESDSQSLASFTNTTQGKHYLEGLVEKYNLCQKHSDLYKTDSSCFRYQTHRCLGACLGKEDVETYNNRVKKALEKLSLGSRNLAILDRGRNAEERTVVWIQRGKYEGFGYVPVDEAIKSPQELRAYIQPFPDNQDVQRIINHYLRTGTPERVWEW